MAIRPVEKGDAPESVRAIYEALEKNLGRIPNTFKMLAHRPEVLRAFLPLYTAVWAEGVFPRSSRRWPQSGPHFSTAATTERGRIPRRLRGSE